jgi:uncharacterized damage-inducible protein DinB
MAADYRNYLVRYDAWANNELLQFLAEHPQLLAASAPGVFGTALETMNHLVVAQASYLNRLSDGQSFVDPPEMALGELVVFAERVARRASEVLRALPPPDQPLQRTYGRFAAETVFGQLIQHGMEHRTQVCTIIGAAGLEAPDLTSWRFGGKV